MYARTNKVKAESERELTSVEGIFSLTSVEGIFSPSCTGIQAGRWVNRRQDNRHNIGYQVPDRLKHISR